MTFQEYLDMRGLTVAAAAAPENLDDPVETVRKWYHGDRLPRPSKIEKIRVWTDGKVGPADWYSAPATPVPAQTPVIPDRKVS